MPRSFALCVCIVSWLFAVPMAAQQADPFGVLAALPATPSVERGVRIAVRDQQGQPVRDAVLVVVGYVALGLAPMAVVGLGFADTWMGIPRPAGVAAPGRIPVGSGAHQ